MSTARPPRALTPLLVLCASLGAALANCSRQPDLDEVFEPPRPRLTSAPAASVVTEFEFARDGHAEFALGSRQRRVQGHLPLTLGRLRIDLANLAATRGELSFDLAALELENALELEKESDVAGSEGAGPKDLGTLTEQSLRWLEVAPPGRLTDKPQLRYARFSIQSVGGCSAPSAEEGQIVQSGSERLDARRVQLRATGELELHGFRIPYTAPVVATFRWPKGSPPSSPPEQVEVTIVEGVGVDLIAHGIVPRDARGDVMAEALAELRKPPASHAKVTGRWLATRSGTPANRAEARPLP